MRGFEIAKTLVGDDHTGIILNSTVWDILEGKRLAVKNIETEEIFYVDAEYLVVASELFLLCRLSKTTTFREFIPPPFSKNDESRTYTSWQKVLTIGAGNIGYLTSYQGMQAGGQIKAIIEAMPNEGGFLFKPIASDV